jgi:hypothetical protein
VVDGARRDEDVLLDFSIFELFEQGLKNGKRNKNKNINAEFSGESGQKKGCGYGSADPSQFHFLFMEKVN